MKLRMGIGYAGEHKKAAARVRDLEKAGLDIVWVAEAYGFDAPSFMGYLAARTERVQIGSGILPIYTRTPTLLAMTAAGLDAVSRRPLHPRARRVRPAGDRGLPRRALRRAARPHPGDHRDLPAGVAAREASSTTAVLHSCRCPPEQGTGLGKPLKIITHPVRDRIPIYVASLGPKNVELTAELADGWLPLFFIPEKAKDVWGDDARRRARPSGRAELGPLEIVAGGAGRDRRRASSRASARLRAGRWSRSTSAAWAPGGRTSTTTWPAATATRRRPRRSRTSTSTARRTRPRRAVPAELLELDAACVGPEGYVKERIAAFKEAGRHDPQRHPDRPRPGEDRREAQAGSE